MGQVPTNFAFSLNKTMEEHFIRLSYSGEFNSDLIGVLLGMSKGTVQMGTAQKKVYSIMIESLENVVRHASSSNENPYPAIFILAQDDEYHYVCTGNKIHNSEIPPLKAKLEKSVNCNKEQLRAWYNEVLTNGQIPSDSEGAGLGIIDMAIKSQESLHFVFTPINEENSFFVLKIKVKQQF